MSIPYVIDGVTDLDSLLFNPLIDAVNASAATIETLGFNVLDYPGVDPTGVTESTAGIQAAFDAADQHGTVYLPPGTYLTDTINYRGQSIIGAGSNLTIIKGLPGKDVFHIEPETSPTTLPQRFREGAHVSGFTIVVDDSVDASASFPNRGGVGNAGIAQDFADAETVLQPLMMSTSSWSDIRFEGSGDVVGGRNNSAGIYAQSNLIFLASTRNLVFYRLNYGWWEDYADNLVAEGVDLSRDHIDTRNTSFVLCGHAWRLCNGNNQFHSTVAMFTCQDSGLTLLGVPSLYRQGLHGTQFHNVMIENTPNPLVFGENVDGIMFEDFSIGAETDVPIAWSADHCTARNMTVGIGLSAAPQVILTGDRNDLEVQFMVSGNSATYLRDLIEDRGASNKVTVWGFAPQSDTVRGKLRISRGVDELHVPDATSLMSGHVSPMYCSGRDLLIHPRHLYPGIGAEEGDDYEFVVDATADHGIALRWLSDSLALVLTDDSINGINGFRVGAFLPPSKVRVYVRVKASAAGTQAWRVDNSSEVSMGGATLSLTTSYATHWFDIDLSGESVDEPLALVGLGMSDPGTMLPYHVAWVAFRPWQNDLMVDGNVGFYGTAPIAQQTGVAVSAAGIHAALVNLGLITA